MSKSKSTSRSKSNFWSQTGGTGEIKGFATDTRVKACYSATDPQGLRNKRRRPNDIDGI